MNFFFYLILKYFSDNLKFLFLVINSNYQITLKTIDAFFSSILEYLYASLNFPRFTKE